MNNTHYLAGHGKILSLESPRIMGILNITPDSFFSGSRQNLDTAIKSAEIMIAEGADILDIGGQSTRPGSERISCQEELSRILPVVKELRRIFPDVWLSIDTYHAEIAKVCFLEGAEIINDISFGEDDHNMISEIQNRDLTYIGMHKKGDPKIMQESPNYTDVVSEVYVYLESRSQLFINKGVKNIVIDPGFGFSKNIQHNFELLKHMDRIKKLPYPILVGISRKSMIYKTLQISAEESLNATTVLHTFSLLNGAHILRVHDVLEAKQAITLTELLQ